MKRCKACASVIIGLVCVLGLVSHDAIARDHGPRFAASSHQSHSH
jgi:hypothetical protein